MNPGPYPIGTPQAARQTITIIEVMQGTHGGLVGLTQAEALEQMATSEAAFLAEHPSCAPYHRPSYHVREVEEHKTAPWGYVWYIADEAGRLRMHSAQYDSSG